MIVEELLKFFGVVEEDILFMFTGVIGKRIKLDKFMLVILILFVNVESSIVVVNVVVIVICIIDFVWKMVVIEV